ncbi:hypothetical protein TSTA_068630 [Talaromyces stipitatus ATCC 10500]|uniref:Uncharacterized protein n=1 Tax=Talaromyces stipitatus (strain ATCC 10500 / CBS 375.48 / QM 6759 / NRRL 1006) TaxID=441959 RepID=B8LYT2_TALSN|nr:uncharacterized protein TSTA_068630 [Talaromyces stipitatus ATCC 10500]EED23440.1 hypothetical protein TSTA_068630 [Talaromyces stipitatus ATCC 10500]
MWDIRSHTRDSTFGKCLRLATGRKLARSPEEQLEFQIPAGYLDLQSSIGDSGNANKEVYFLVVGWHSKDDPDNLHNWSFRKKLWVSILFVYRFSVYIGSSLYTASTSDIMQIYGVVGMFLLYRYGARLRERSRFTGM